MHTTLTLTLPADVYDLLANSHAKGAEAAAMLALKRYLKSLPTTTNAERDAIIADKAVADIPLKLLAQEYGLSYIRIQQIVAKNKQAAYERKDAQINARLRAIFGDKPL
jgi:hypothetical protein